MDYLVSVVIPVYNIEKYVKKCLDSVIDQTLKDIEIIVVDDGSTDDSGKICDEYAAKDERIRVLHKSNGGLSAARNDGIKMSKAPYIMFVDGDDWAEPDLCETPYKMALENNADLVLFSYKRIYTDGTVKDFETGRESGVLTEAEAIHYNAFVSWAAWTGLYSRKLFDSVLFPDGKLHEDTGTTHRFIHEANKIYLLNKYLYDYRKNRAGSIMSIPDTREHPDHGEMLIRKASDLYDWGYTQYAQFFTLKALISYGAKKDEADRIRKILKNGKAPAFFDWRYKIMLHIFRLSPSMFEAIRKLMGKR